MARRPPHRPLGVARLFGFASFRFALTEISDQFRRGREVVNLKYMEVPIGRFECLGIAPSSIVIGLVEVNVLPSRAVIISICHAMTGTFINSQSGTPSQT